MVYAQLDENNIVIAITNLYEEIFEKNMIKINSYDISLLGKKYNNGDFEEIFEENDNILSQNELEKIAFEEKIDYLTTLLEINGGLLNV